MDSLGAGALWGCAIGLGLIFTGITPLVILGIIIAVLTCGLVLLLIAG